MELKKMACNETSFILFLTYSRARYSVSILIFFGLLTHLLANVIDNNNDNMVKRKK